MAQPTTASAPTSYNNFTDQASLLERRQQNAPFLQQLELPSLPPLSQLLTSDSTANKDQPTPNTQAATEAAIAAATAVTASMITSTTQPIIQETFLPTHQKPTTNNLLYGFQQQPTTSTSPIMTSNALLNDSVAIFPTTTDASLDQTLMASDHHFLDPQQQMFNAAAAVAAATAGLTDPHGVNPTMSMPPSFMERQRQSSVSSTSSDKVYSFVAIPGTNQRKRPRRRYDEIERLYHCNWLGCTKAYGTLNHLNAHVSMQQHGPKRHPTEFKEMRKEWRRQKKERDAAKKSAEQAYRNQQESMMQQHVQQQQQHQQHHHHPQTHHQAMPFPFQQSFMPNNMALGNFY
ncbi:uncharacterized protein ATC70_001803 [Mucor velutinosus]|uniref:C2H2-type domain-containing protein n=1 Tax=Mucor velutinosus TaxID=708070 RepID=A0AAN7DGT3_9FUNG|nr:hypothetical protein ATC70_001803 [Mucor velutinosus]